MISKPNPKRWFPLIADLGHYGRAGLGEDLLAGVITAILLVPQAMAYALLAGLPPQMGLYAAVLPPLVYALLGSSRTLAVGPVAVAALMVAHALDQYAGGDPALWVTGAIILAAETGLVLLVLGVFRLGTLVSFISHPVLAGFTSGAALLIITSQLPHLTGLDLGRGDAFATVRAAAANIGGTHLPTLAFGLVAIALLMAGRGPLTRGLEHAGLRAQTAGMISRAVPLSVVMLTTALAAWLAPVTSGDLSVVGPIPEGLPSPSISFLWASGWLSLLPSATLIALVGYVESVSVAKVLAARRRQKVDANRELIALGASNLTAAAAGAMPVAGGFSRSVVNFDAGARTQVAGIVTAVLVAIVAAYFTGWFHYLPHAVLAAIIVVAVAQLVDFGRLREIWNYDRFDGAALATTLVTVLVLGIEIGLVAGITVSLALHLRRTSRPHIAVVGRVPGTGHFRNIIRHSVETSPNLLVVRVDESICFANAAEVEEFIIHRLAGAPSTSALLLDMAAVNHIDASGLEMLAHLEQDLAESGTLLYLAEVKGPVQDRLDRTRFGEHLATRTYLSTNEAFEALIQGSIAAPEPTASTPTSERRSPTADHEKADTNDP